MPRNVRNFCMRPRRSDRVRFFLLWWASYCDDISRPVIIGYCASLLRHAARSPDADLWHATGCLVREVLSHNDRAACACFQQDFPGSFSYA